MCVSFESILEHENIIPLQIIEDGTVIARGIWVNQALTAFCDGQTSTISYSDTGVFVLFKGSQAFSAEDKYRKYIDNHITTREIVFQSRQAAAQFVLGSKGRTNYWK